MKRMKLSVAILAAAVMLVPIAMSGSGCNGSDSEGATTAVRMNISRASEVESGLAARPIVDPAAHPYVGVMVIVTAPDMATLTYIFQPGEVAAMSGVVTIEVPTGQARTFYVKAVDIDPTPAADTFPGVVYATQDAAAARTYDLTGVTLLLNLSLTQLPTHDMSGFITDARTGSFQPLQMCAMPDVSMTFSMTSWPELIFAITPINVGSTGDYILANVPDGESFVIGAGDVSTGAVTADAIAADLTAHDFDLIGAGPLSINPTSATVGPGDTIQFTSSGGTAGHQFEPYGGGAFVVALTDGSISSAILYPTMSGGAISDTGAYLAGPNMDTIDDIQVTDACFFDEFSTPESFAMASVLVSMTNQCADGIDNDGDTVIDFPSDPGCAGTLDPTEYGLNECDDGWDNDEDMATDYPDDPECTSPADLTEWTSSVWDCSDLVDNDGDTLTDYPNDPGCWGVMDSDELGSVECDDGIDNDGDTATDYPDDADCSDPADISEYPGTVF